MANDIVFKTKAFGGFNKDEVMDFVNRAIADKSALERNLADANSKLASANAEIQAQKSVVEQYNKLSEDFIASQGRVSELENQLTLKDVELAQLNIAVLSKDSEIDSLSQQLAQARTSDDVQAEIDSLKAEVTRLRAECDKKRDMERQVGAAMLDARVHSEELVEAAKKRADSVTKSVYSAIGETALKIDDLSTGIGEIARSFTKSVEEVELRIKALTGDMSKTAQLLISDSGIITDSHGESVKEVEYDFLTDKPDDDNSGVMDQ